MFRAGCGHDPRVLVVYRGVHVASGVGLLTFVPIRKDNDGSVTYGHTVTRCVDDRFYLILCRHAAASRSSVTHGGSGRAGGVCGGSLRLEIAAMLDRARSFSATAKCTETLRKI